MKLYGASGHAKVIIDILNANNIEISEIFDDNRLITSLNGCVVSSPRETNEELIISIGNNEIRKKIVEKRYTSKYGIAIHPSAIISSFAKIGEGTVVMPGAIIQSGAVIGKHCIINTGAKIDHDCIIDDYVHISPNATLCGNIHIGEGTQVGVGSSIVPGIKIGKWTLVCAGSVVTTDIPDNCVAAGNFCTIKRYKNDFNNHK